MRVPPPLTVKEPVPLNPPVKVSVLALVLMIAEPVKEPMRAEVMPEVVSNVAVPMVRRPVEAPKLLSFEMLNVPVPIFVPPE